MYDNSKKKRFLPLQPSSITSKPKFFSSLLSLLIFIIIFLFVFHGNSPNTFKPVLTIHPLSHFAIQNPHSESLVRIKVIDRILFPDHVLLLVSKNDHALFYSYRILSEVYCVYRLRDKVVEMEMLSVDEYNELESIVRCPLPPKNSSIIVELYRHGSSREKGLLKEADSVHSWDGLVYGAVLDGSTAVVFVKRLNLRADRASDSSQFSCHFGWGDSERNTKYVLTTIAITDAQEALLDLGSFHCL